jgi:hypothetical protein
MDLWSPFTTRFAAGRNMDLQKYFYHTFWVTNLLLFEPVAKRAGIWVYEVLLLHVLSGIYDLPARGLCSSFYLAT